MIFRPHIFSNVTTLISQLSELRLFPRTSLRFCISWYNKNKSRRNWRRFRRYF